MSSIQKRYYQAQGLAEAGAHGKALKRIEDINHETVNAFRIKVQQTQRRKRYWQAGVLALLVVAIGIVASVLRPREVSDFMVHYRMQNVCQEVYFDYYLENDISAAGFNDACREEAAFAVQRYELEIRYCLEQSDDGERLQAFINCLGDEGVEFIGTHMLTAE